MCRIRHRCRVRAGAGAASSGYFFLESKISFRFSTFSTYSAASFRITAVMSFPSKAQAIFNRVWSSSGMLTCSFLMMRGYNHIISLSSYFLDDRGPLSHQDTGVAGPAHEFGLSDFQHQRPRGGVDRLSLIQSFKDFSDRSCLIWFCLSGFMRSRCAAFAEVCRKPFVKVDETTLCRITPTAV